MRFSLKISSLKVKVLFVVKQADTKEEKLKDSRHEQPNKRSAQNAQD